MSVSRAPFISVIIATFGRHDLLRRCVRSVIANDYEDYEILVIDQEEGGPLKAALASEDPGGKIRYLQLPRSGLSRARNFGVQESGGDILAFIDDDAVACPGWLTAIADAFSLGLEPSPALLAGRIRPLWPDGGAPEWYPEPRRFLLGLYDLGDEIREMPEHDQPVGANMAGLREVIVSAGGFEERLGVNVYGAAPMIAGEDTLLSMRVRKAGGSIYYHPGMMVHHQISRNKLARSTFLRRNFWEGVTIIRENHLLDGRGFRFGATVRWHLREMAFAAARFVLPGYRRDYALPNAAVRMLALSRIWYSAGVIRELTRLRLAPPEPSAAAPKESLLDRS